MLGTRRQITGYGWSYILNVKPDSHKSLFKQFEGRKRRGQVKSYSPVDEVGTTHYYEWTNQLWLCESASDVRVNYLFYEERKVNGEVKRWTWITDLKLSQRNLLEKVMRGGRARWKIEKAHLQHIKESRLPF